MVIYIDNENRIKDVDKTNDPTLTPIEVTDEFDGWSAAKICCYKVYLTDGKITGYTPYVDSRMIDHIDQLGREVDAITPYTETKTAYIGDTEVTFTDIPQGNITIYFDHPYTMEKLADRIIVTFDELEEVAEITISII